MTQTNGPPPGASTALALSSFSDTTPVVIDATDQPLALTVDDVLRYIAPGAPRGEALTFLLTCKAMRLNPLLKEAFLIPQKDKWATVVAKSGYLLAAQRHESYDGHEAGIVGQPYDASQVRANAPPPYTGPPIDFEGSLLPAGHLLVGGWAKVWRKGVGRPITSRVSMQEYARNSPGPWQTMTATMIRKVALVAALREAFSLSGYDESEMPVTQPVEPAARTFTATVVTPSDPTLPPVELVGPTPAGGYSFRPAPVSPIGSIAHEPAAPPVPAAERASPEQVARLKDLFARVGLTDYQINLALTKRGVDRVEELAATDARGIADKLESKLSAAEWDPLGGKDAGEDARKHAGKPRDESEEVSTTVTQEMMTALGDTSTPSVAFEPAAGDAPAPDVDADGFDWATGTTAADRERMKLEAGPDPSGDEKPAKTAGKKDKKAEKAAEKASVSP